ncbi:hypothetical protein M406DRAFT_352375 [Cryphonectria parasitica EP155]|uniref:Uncharacterized protein n=1 Tax=Cryphonectria parasitica (strain ATCC 38755 / EP155) TaxID=660469 RepID=A0A9P4XZ09_CRYP1|nr:uncharacterized protein M406DRAFT_352375 [Cryphonectria parasitica EP155]KAF3763511.1 hypothetical protein M406DRAFT_352375 [Cryphonectria parasitica EP155]
MDAMTITAEEARPSAIMRKKQRPLSLSIIDYQSSKRVIVCSDQGACTPPCTDHAPPTSRSRPTPKNSVKKRRLEDWLGEVRAILPSELLLSTNLSALRAESSRIAEGSDNEFYINEFQPTSVTSGSQPELVELSTYRDFHLGDS